VIGSWLVAGEPAGINLREDATPITTDAAWFLPHVIMP
jgi:glutathionylspermidine synthase